MAFMKKESRAPQLSSWERRGVPADIWGTFLLGALWLLLVWLF